MMTPRRPRVLLLLWQTTIGSGLTAIPAIQAIQQHEPLDTDYWLLIRPLPKNAGNSHPAYLLQPWLNLVNVLTLPPRLRSPIAWLVLLFKVRALHFTTAMYVDASAPNHISRRVLLAFCHAAGLDQPVGLSAHRPHHGRSVHEATRRLSNLRQHGLPLAEAQPQRVFAPPPGTADLPRWLSSQRRPQHKLIAICPGTRASANAWPMARFLALGRQLLARGDCDLMICGGPAERAIAQELSTAWGHGINAAGIFSLTDSAHLLSRCDLVIGLDTGTSHLAASLGVPVIVLQGGRCPEGQWDPLGPHVEILRWPVPCSGCGLRACPLHSHPCMRGLTVEDVMLAAHRTLPLQPALTP